MAYLNLAIEGYWSDRLKAELERIFTTQQVTVAPLDHGNAIAVTIRSPFSLPKSVSFPVKHGDRAEDVAARVAREVAA